MLLGFFSRENLSKYWHYCQMYGFQNATRLALRRLRKPKGAPRSDPPRLQWPLAGPSLVPPVTRTVSVVIPTKNAGTDLEPLLQRLHAQEGISNSELIVVDSGSTDRTRDVAEQRGARVLQIAPAQFTHAFARNHGAQAANGDYLLFLVQDSLPLTNRWLWELIHALENNQLAAVSCAEYPRSDSDLFYQFLIHTQYEADGLNRDRIMAWDSSCSSYLGLRSNTQLSDVALLIRRDVFKGYRYRVPYGEDLELGLRLIRDGHRLGFLHSVRVLHSHNRPAYYFLKRAYADVRFLIDVFPNFLYPQISEGDRLCSEILFLFNGLGELAQMNFVPDFALAFPDFMNQLREKLITLGNSGSYMENRDDELRELLRQLAGGSRLSSPSFDTNHGMVLSHVLAHFDRFRDWVLGIYDAADQKIAHEVMAAVEKILALHCGTHLAYLYLTAKAYDRTTELIRRMDETLTAGI